MILIQNIPSWHLVPYLYGQVLHDLIKEITISIGLPASIKVIVIMIKTCSWTWPAWSWEHVAPTEWGSVRWITDGSPVFVKWMGTKGAVCATIYAGLSDQMVQRKVKGGDGRWAVRDIPCLTPVVFYNKCMDGADSLLLLQQQKNCLWLGHHVAPLPGHCNNKCVHLTPRGEQCQAGAAKRYKHISWWCWCVSFVAWTKQESWSHSWAHCHRPRCWPKTPQEGGRTWKRQACNVPHCLVDKNSYVLFFFVCLHLIVL